MKRFSGAQLEYLKAANKMDKDEAFLYGFMIGNEAGMKAILSQEYGDDGAKDLVEDVLTPQVKFDLWDSMASELGLNVRSLAEILPNLMN